MTIYMETKSNSIAADSSAIISLLSETDSNHELARQALNNLPQSVTALLVPDAIFYEHLDAIGKRYGHATAIAAAHWILNQELVVIVNTEGYRTEILELFANQPNGVSLADCAVMATAKKFDTKLIFGF